MDVLIEAAELITALDPEAPSPRPVVIDVRWTLNGPSRLPDFLAGHIPGAHWVDLETELSDHHRTGGRHPLPEPPAFEAAMRRAGVDLDTPVVVYDADNALAAARLWWMLVDAGHQHVRVLNGGFTAWHKAGGPLETGAGSAVQPGNFVAQPGQLPRIDGDALAAQIAAGTVGTVIDVRGAERYAGEMEPIDPVAGHIPGAINVPSMVNVDSDGRFRRRSEISDNFAEDTAPADEAPVVYCGSGITAAHTALARVWAGLSMPTVYPGSWSDWVSDSSRPVATGDQP